MSGSPTVIVSYSGMLGGAERILLDCATRLGEPVVVACPEGPLAEAVRTAGLEHAALQERPLRLGAAHARGLAGLEREVHALAVRRRPSALVAWGARAVLATAPLRRRPPLLAVHMDLLPRRGVAAAVRWATRRTDGVAAASEAIAAAVAAPATILRPGVDLDRFAASAAPPSGRRGRSRSPPSCRGSARTWRSRSPRACPGSGSSSRERRFPATRAVSCASSRRARPPATWPAA